MTGTNKSIRILLAAVLLLWVQGLYAQKYLSGTVRDVQSDERIPFASITFKGTAYGGLTDSAGGFSFAYPEWPSDTVIVSCVGYQPYSFYLPTDSTRITVEIQMERGTFNEGVQVKVRINRGLWVWRKIVQHKDKNNRYKFDNFSYELYNKLELDIKNLNFRRFTKLKPLRNLDDIITSHMVDSLGQDQKYLPAYLTEAVSDYYYQKKPQKRREVIKGVNTNGVKNESILKFLGGMDQNINVYNNFIPVFDKQFVSPASDNGDMYYNYNVIDTQMIGGQRYFHLTFVPRRKGSSTFEGDCWVHVGSYAIQRMNLRLGKDANINFVESLSLIQEFSLINDSTWFLTKDKFVADISPAGKKVPGVIGRKTTTYRNIIVNDSTVTAELVKNKKLEEVVVVDEANNKDSSYWSSSRSRHEELSRIEKGIINMLDTLNNSPSFQRLTKQLKFLATGYFDVGNVELGSAFNWFTANGWEGFRMRFDVASNKYFDKHFWYHGYLAYGFGDKKFKGKGEFFYLPKKDPRQYFLLSYTNDLDFGQNYYGEVTQDNIFALAIRKRNVTRKYLRVEEKKFEFFNETRSGFSTLFTLNHKNYYPLLNLPPKDSFDLPRSQAMTTAEVSLRLRFAYLEKFLESTFFRTSLGSPYPIIEANITKGFKNVLSSGYNYTKISASISDYINVPPLGNISFNVFGGKTFGKLPYVFLDMAPGNDLFYYNRHAYNMMNRFEFLHDQYAGVNFEHNIGSGIFRIMPKLKFRQFWTAKALWGSLSDANRQMNFKEGNLFQSLNGKTYLELGTGIDNILRFIRIDCVWRVLPTSELRSAGYVTKRFGVFGSFRLAF